MPNGFTSDNLKKHSPLLLVLLLHLALSLAYASLIPLGEAPDEPAHLSYAQFIARNGHLPTTLAERREAGYRSTWPPLYQLLLTGPLQAVGNAPPTRLKAVGDTPRRLIPTNGQTIASFIHTVDEAWPWRGLPLAWHLSRIISVILSTLAIIPTYIIAWRLTRQRNAALGAAALHATIPQVLFIGSVLNDDNLLIFLSGLILLLLVFVSQRSTPSGLGPVFLLGALLGLATVTKYNALPLWVITILWIIWLICRPSSTAAQPRIRKLAYPLTSLVILTVGAILTSGWWFIFIWHNFNQVDTQGPLAGSLAAIIAGTSDTTLRQLSSELSITFPPLVLWLEWFVTLFKSFWGLFGGGSTIEFPGWTYWLLALFCFLAAIPYFIYFISRLTGAGVPGNAKFSPLSAPYPLLLLTPLFFLPLPLLRFLLSGNVVETAQGRHLFPALPAITLALIWGLFSLKNQFSSIAPHVSRVSTLPAGVRVFLPLSFILFSTILSLYGLPLIRSSYPPPIPLHTTAEVLTVENQLRIKLVDGVTLVGYEVGQAKEGILPLTLVWQADSIPGEDYLIDLTLTASTGQPGGGWVGHPSGGRYPTRAWDEGDILRDVIPIPLLPGLPATEAILDLTLLNTASQPASSPVTLVTGIPISPVPLLPRTPGQLRADGLPPADPFTYRSTLSFSLPDNTSPKLIAPDNQTFTPFKMTSVATGSIAHFIIGPNWPTGEYRLDISDSRFTIINRLRQFEPPPMQYTLDANFADHLTLLGYDLPQRRVQPGETFPLTLHFRADRTMGQNLVIFNHLLDQNAIQRGGIDRLPQQYYTSLLWVPGEIVSDAYDVPIEATAPPGIYWLDVGLYPSDQPTFSLPLFVDGQPIDRNSVRLGPLKVGGPPPDVTVPKAHPQHPLNQTFGDEITLLGFDLLDTKGNPIQNSTLNTRDLTLTLYWQTNAIPPTDYTVFVHLLNPDDNLIAQADSPPANGAYPTSLWDVSEIIVDEHEISDLPPGRYTLQVGLYRPETGKRLPVNGVPEGAVRLMEFEVEE